MKIECVYKDETGAQIDIGDYVVYSDSDNPDKLYLYKLEFGRKDACIICKTLKKVNNTIEVTDYDAMADVVNLYLDMSEDGSIKGFTRLNASTDEEAYLIYEEMLYALEWMPIQLSKVRLQNSELYYTIKAMQAGSIDYLEIKDGNGLIEWSYEITADENKYYVKDTTIDGNAKKIKNYVIEVEKA